MIPARIAYVVKVFPKLSETFIASELAELLRRGVEVRVLSLMRPVETLRHKFVARAGLDALTSYDADEFRTVLERFRPQLLHAHFATEPTARARELSRELGVPFSFTAHGYDIRRKPPPDMADRAAAALAVITVSQANARTLTDRFGVVQERIHVIPCGVDTASFRPSPARELSNGPPMIVCVARHVKVKNLGLLLECCAALRDGGMDFRCVQVGDGPCRQELEARRAELGLEAHVEFTGAAEQAAIVAWWQRAAVAVLTSENEGMPLCLMEAAACGVPAVATAVGGIPELIEDGVTGFLAAPSDAEGLAGAVRRLLDDPSRAARMGRAARCRVEEHFALARQVDRMLNLWASLLDDRETD